MAIEMSKSYRTRDGRPVRIYAVDGSPPHCVHGAALDRDNQQWFHGSWTAEGKYSTCSQTSLDLIEVRPMRRVKGFLNVYVSPVLSPELQTTIHLTRELADMYAYGSSRDRRIACIEIDVETEDLSHGQ